MKISLASNVIVENIDSIRLRAFTGYCIFQVVYSIIMLLYGLRVPALFSTLVPTALVAIPIYIISALIARKNYRMTVRIFISFSFLTQSIFLLARDLNPGMIIISLMVYFSIGLLSMVTIGRTWVMIMYILAAICFAVSILRSDFSFQNETHTFDMQFLVFHISSFGTGLFVFGAYLIYLFEKYLGLYLSELDSRTKLNDSLEEKISQLNELNRNLEKQSAAITHANDKLSQYAWLHSHEVKASVARIIGLINITRLDPALDKEFIFQSIWSIADELDSSLVKMSYLLNEVKRP